jgi:zinc transport system ATP-binding protein
MKAETVIQLEGVGFSYAGPPVLENVSLSVQAGEFLGLVGPNGGGKSTLLKLVLGLLTPDRGRLSVLGKSARRASRAIGYVPQHANFARDFPISVEDTVLLGRLGRNLFGGWRKNDRQVAEQAMREAGVLNLRKRPVGQLSGGQLQRVLIARALACQPQILILDEPTSNIDMRAEGEIFDLLEEFNARMTILVVSHDIAFISRYVTRVACLNRTLVCHQTERLSGETIQKLYEMPVQAIHHAHS